MIAKILLATAILAINIYVLVSLIKPEKRVSIVWQSARRIAIIISLSIIAILATLLMASYLSINKGLFYLYEIFIRAFISGLWSLLVFETIYVDTKQKSIRQEQELRALNDIALVISKSTDLKQILHEALITVLNISDSDIGFIYLYNFAKKKLEIVAAHGPIPPDLAKKLVTLRVGQEV